MENKRCPNVLVLTCTTCRVVESEEERSCLDAVYTDTKKTKQINKGCISGKEVTKSS